MSDYIQQDDGTLAPRPEMIADSVRRYLKGLGYPGLTTKVATLSSTPLSQVIEKNYTALITYAVSNHFVPPTPTFCIYSHLRTALIKQCLKTQGEWGPSVIIEDPIQLMRDLMDDDESPKLIRCDVLVVLATAFPYYAAAQQHIGNLLRMRHGLGKCSIFAKPSTYELLKRPEKATDVDFVQFMSDPTAVAHTTLQEANLPKLIVRLHDVDIPGFTPKPKKRK